MHCTRVKTVKSSVELWLDRHGMEGVRCEGRRLLNALEKDLQVVMSVMCD